MEINISPTNNVLHVCSHLHVGGKTTFVESLITLNRYYDNMHDLLLLFKSDNKKIERFCRVHYLVFGKINFIQNFLNLRNIIKNYSAIMIHSAHPIVIFPFLFSKKQIFLFQHGMSINSGFVLMRLIKKMWYSILPVVLNAKTICSTEFAFVKTRGSGIILCKNNNITIPFGIRLNQKVGKIRDIMGKDTITVGMANNLVSGKRNDIVLKSLQTYKGEKRINLKIAGDGTELEYLKMLTDKITSNKVQVDFLGEVHDMDSFYDDLDIFILPSKDESFGLVVLEALTRLIPVIVFQDVGGCISLIDDGKNGFITQRGIEGLAFIWKVLNEHPEIISEQSKFISLMDFRKYDINNTRKKLDRLINQKKSY